jgi:hypothetical protein
VIIGSNPVHCLYICLFLNIIIILCTGKIYLILGSDTMNIHPIQVKYKYSHLSVKCSHKQDNLRIPEERALEKYSMEAQMSVITSVRFVDLLDFRKLHILQQQNLQLCNLCFDR